MTIIFNAKVNKASGCGCWGTPSEHQGRYYFNGNDTKGPVAFKGTIEDKNGNVISTVRCAWVSMPTHQDPDDGEYVLTYQSDRNITLQKLDFGQYYDYYLSIDA